VLYAELSKVSTDCLFFRRHHFLFFDHARLRLVSRRAYRHNSVTDQNRVSGFKEKGNVAISTVIYFFPDAHTVRCRRARSKSTAGKPNTDQVVQQKMKNSEDPSSPAMQQAAAKKADCKKQAKAQKLSGAKRRAFMKDCTK